MRKTLGKRAVMIAATAVAVIALSAAAAFAAPVLQPGQTSAPGMHGTCTDCHTYAKAVAATPAKKPATPRPSHPYFKKAKHRRGVAFRTWGYVSPRLASTTEATVTIRVQKWNGHGKWITDTSLDQTATISATGRFKRKTNYTALLTVPKTGRYRAGAVLVYKDSSAVVHTRWSSYAKFRVAK